MAQSYCATILTDLFSLVLLTSVKVQMGNRPHHDSVRIYFVVLSNLNTIVTGLVDSIIAHSATPRDRTRRWYSPIVPLF
jgi:hypothetical protein